MKYVLAALALLGSVTLAYAACTSHTYMVNGRTIFCTTCCYSGNCTTTCS